MKYSAFWPTARFRSSRRTLTTLVLSLLATALAAQSAPPTEGSPPPAAASPAKPDAATAWTELRDSLQQKIESAADPQAAMPGVLADLQKFAADYQGSEEAVAALFNHGMLSLELGHAADAERSLRRAAALATDPEFAAFIKSRLAQLALRPGQPPPDFAAPTLVGKLVTPENFHGRVLLLDFWATWCDPCLAELPNVQQVYRTQHAAGFDIISVSLDRDKTALTDFIAQGEMPWTHVYNADQPRGESVAAKYGVNAIPFMVLVGRDGRIAGINLRGPALAEAVAAALAAPTGAAN